MRNIVYVLAICAVMLGVGYSNVLLAAEGDSAALAALYEQKAAEQDSLISVHERMKVDPDLRRRNQSATAVQEMDRHCDGIIASSKALKEELLGFAEWHRKQG